MYTAVTPLQDALTRRVRRILYLLWGGAAFVLLIGRINIANLSLARSSVRARELATRLALGAGRLRWSRQLIIEGVLLAALGGVAGVGVGAGILQALASSGMANMPNAADVRMDWTTSASHRGGVGAGRRADRTGAGGDRGATQPQSGSRRRKPARNRRTRDAPVPAGLVVTQVALSVVLLIGAGLLLTSFRNLLAVDAGFDAQRVDDGDDLSAAVALSGPALRWWPCRIACWNRSARIPGVEAAGITSNIALSGRTSPATVSAAGDAPRPAKPGAPVGGQRHARILRSDGDAADPRPVLCRKRPREHACASRSSTSVSRHGSGRARIRSGRASSRGELRALHGRGCGSRRAVRKSGRADRIGRRSLLPAHAGAAAGPAAVDRDQDGRRSAAVDPRGSIGADGDRSRSAARPTSRR